MMDQVDIYTCKEEMGDRYIGKGKKRRKGGPKGTKVTKEICK
jgi:hypothetical protein